MGAMTETVVGKMVERNTELRKEKKNDEWSDKKGSELFIGKNIGKEKMLRLKEN